MSEVRVPYIRVFGRTYLCGRGLKIPALTLLAVRDVLILPFFKTGGHVLSPKQAIPELCVMQARSPWRFANAHPISGGHPSKTARGKKCQQSVELRRHVARSRISLVPRGTCDDMSCFFESLKAGCVVICEPLPELYSMRDIRA